MGTRVDTRGGNGEYRRRRASGRCAHLDRQTHSNDSRNRPARQRRGDGDTRRFRTAYRRACPFNGGLPAAVLPPAQLRTPMIARHSRRFLTQNRAPGRFEGRKFWRPRGKACFDIRQLVYSLLPSSGLFWVNAHCRRLSARVPPGTATARGYMIVGDGGLRWMVA